MLGWLSPQSKRSHSSRSGKSGSEAQKTLSLDSMIAQHSPTQSFFDESMTANLPPRSQSEKLHKQRLSKSSLNHRSRYTSRTSEEGSQAGTKSVSTDRPSLKYSTLSPIQRKLWDELGRGIAIVKHSRRGVPKKKILFCDEDVSELLWQSDNEDEEGPTTPELEPGYHRSIKLQNVLSVRLGTDIDPVTSEQALVTALKTGRINEQDLSSVQREKERCQPALKQQPNSPVPLLGSVFGYKMEPKDILMFGTVNLRRSCPWNRLSYSLSLILPDRTLDIECMCKGDLKFLYFTLSDYIHGLRGEPVEDAEKYNAAVRELKLQASDVASSPELSSSSSEVAPELELVRIPSTDSILKINDFSRKMSSFSQKSVSFSDEVKGPSMAADKKTESSPSQGRKLTADDHKASDPFLLYTAQNSNSVAQKARYLGYLLAEQEKKFGSNMFLSVEAKDEPEIQQYLEQGLSSEEALLRVFERKYVLGQKQTLKASIAMLNRSRDEQDHGDYTSGESGDSTEDQRHNESNQSLNLELSIDVDDIPDVYISTASNTPSPMAKMVYSPAKVSAAEVDQKQVQRYMDQGLTYSQAAVLLQSNHASNAAMSSWLSTSNHMSSGQYANSPQGWKPPISPVYSNPAGKSPTSSAASSNRNSLSYSPIGYSVNNPPVRYSPPSNADAKSSSGRISVGYPPSPTTYRTRNMPHVEQSFYGDVVPMSLNDSFFTTKPIRMMYEAAAKSNSTSFSSVNSSRDRMYKSDSDDEKATSPLPHMTDPRRTFADQARHELQGSNYSNSSSSNGNIPITIVESDGKKVHQRSSVTKSCSTPIAALAST